MLVNLLVASLLFSLASLLAPFFLARKISSTLKWSSTWGRIQICIFLTITVTLTFFMPYYVAGLIIFFGIPFGITNNPEEAREFLKNIIEYQGIWMIFPAIIAGAMFWKWYCKSQKT